MKRLKAPKNQKQWNVGLEDREKLYREWRMIEKGGHVQNIDQYEYAIMDNNIIPVAIIELSKAESPVQYPDRYFDKLNSSKGKITQNNVVRKIASLTNCSAFFVVFDDNFDKLLIQQIRKKGVSKIYEKTPEEWGEFIRKLHKRKINEYMIAKSKKMRKDYDKSNSITK